MSNVCKCGKYRDKRTSGPNSKFPGRQYYACDGPGGCGTFDWAASANQLTAAAGPECKCGKASVQRAVTAATNPNKGKKFWACAAGKPPTGCGFFQWQEASHASPRRPPALPPAQPAPQRPALPGYAQHLGDWHQNETLRQMMQCDPALLGSGRDLRQPGNYDTLEVVGSWRIVNKQRKQQYQAALERVGASPVPTEELVRLPDEFASATSRLGGDPLDSRANEAFLLHGTKPEHLHGILFEGLDPTVAADGLFGRGTYFAESAGKIDQYTTLDTKFQKDGPIAELHEKLYKAQMQPMRVRYALVCRVALGRSAHTKDGKTRVDDGEEVFGDDARSKLAPLADGSAPTSLVAELGDRIARFREFVVFSPDQILVEYLVAYQRKRTLCDCGEPAIERTVVNGHNRNRKVHFCAKPKDDKDNCGYVVVFPTCFCDIAARVKLSKAGKKYYGCGKQRGDWCDFYGGPAPDDVDVTPSYPSGSPSRKRAWGSPW